MRTTLTLDDDVASLLAKEARRSGEPLKKVVNHFLRLGLSAGKRLASKPFKVTPFKMELPDGMTFDNVAELIELLEGPTHR